MGGGGGSNNDTKTTFVPWGEQAPHLYNIYQRANQLSYQPKQFYPGSTVAPQDPATLDAQALIEARAREGSPLVDQAQDYTSRVAGGEYLNANPYLDETYDRAASAVSRNFNLATLPALETRFATAGRLGGGAYGHALKGAAGELGDSLAGLATDIYGQNYARERGIQDSASTRLPGLAAADYADAERLGGVGAEREAFSQQGLNELIDRFNFAQDEPGQRLAEYSGLVGEPVGGSKTNVGRSPTDYLKILLTGGLGKN